MANFFDFLNPFKIGKKKREQKGIDPQFLKRTPPHKTEPGALAFDELKRRLQGLGLGIPEEVLESAGGPIADPIRRGVARAQERAAAARSAAGVGKSTIAGAQTGDIALRGEEKIADQLARLRIANEELKRRELDTAIAGLQQFGRSAATTSAAEKALSVREFERQQGIRDERVEEANKDLQKLQALGLTIAGAGAGEYFGIGAGTGASIASRIFGSGEGGGLTEEEKGWLDEIFERRGLGAKKQKV